MEKLFKGFLLVLLISCAFGQQKIACQVCQRVKQCDQSLLSDGNIDLIYNSIIQQLSITDYPLRIECVKTSAEATYTFSWSADVYQAIVDLKTRDYKVIKAQQNPAFQSVESVQNALGVRESSILQTNENIIARIDQDIRGKYCSNVNVKCVSILPVQGGYHAIYEKADTSRIEFDAVLSTSGGNTFISYKTCEASTIVDNKQGQGVNQGLLASGQGASNIWFNGQAVTIPYAINPSQISIKPINVPTIPGLQVQPAQLVPQPQPAQPVSQVQPTKPAPQPQPITQTQPVPAPVIGGYTQIQVNDDGVLKVLDFLKQQFGSIISGCSIIKA